MCSSLSLLTAPSSYASLMHSLGSIELPIHVFCGYIIIFKTPSAMQSVKYPLLYYHFWCSTLDLLITLLITPYPLLPELATFPLGFLRYLEISTANQIFFYSTTCCSKLSLIRKSYQLLSLSLISVIGVSLIVVFENRFISIANPKMFCSNWSLFHYLFLITNHLMALAFPLPIYLILPDQVIARNQLIANRQCLHVSEDILVIGTDNLVIRIMLFFNLPVIIWLSSQVFIYLFLTFGKLNSDSKKRIISPVTLSLRKKFFTAILIQLSIPFIVITGPIFCGVLALLLEYRIQGKPGIFINWLSAYQIWAIWHFWSLLLTAWCQVWWFWWFIKHIEMRLWRFSAGHKWEFVNLQCSFQINSLSVFYQSKL